MVKVDAANNTIRGRVLTAAGEPIEGAQVTLKGTDGQELVATSTATGVYEFGDLIYGETYTLRLRARRYTFNAVSVSMSQNLVEVYLTALRVDDTD